MSLFKEAVLQTRGHLFDPDANAAKLYRKARLHTRYLREPSLHLQGSSFVPFVFSLRTLGTWLIKLPVGSYKIRLTNSIDIDNETSICIYLLCVKGNTCTRKN